MYGEDTALRSKAVAGGMFTATPGDVPAPGETLHLRLAELGMTQSELAVRTGLTTKHMSQLMNGLVPLTADVARRLEYATGVPARWWNRLEADFRSAQTRAQPQKSTAEHARWVKAMPVRHLVNAGALPAVPDDLLSRLSQLLTFFGVATPEAWDALWSRPAAAFRQSSAHDVDSAAVAAWLRLGELAADGPTAAFDAAAVRAALPELRRLTTEPLLTAWPTARGLLADAGVVVVLVPEVPGTRAWGAARWRSGTPLVQLSLRGKTEDAFWTTLLHEIGHVLLHGRRASFVELGDPDNAPDDASAHDNAAAEREAHAFALEHLLGHGTDNMLPDLLGDDDAVALAEQFGVSPGLIVARLHALSLWDRRRGAHLRRRAPSIDALLAGSPAQARPRPARKPRGTQSHGDGRDAT